jgi:cell division protein FtsL
LLLSALVLLQVSAIAVIYSTYKNRQLFSGLQELKAESREMQVVWRQLLLEQSTLASFNRVLEVADTELSMMAPDPETIVILHP